MLYYFNMSRVLAVPDVHGNKIVLENAKVAYEKHKPDFVVFVGDYVDSHVDGNSWIQQQEQLKAILDWKKELNKEKEICFTLFGNHDLSYMYNYGGVECSGHQFFVSQDIQEFFCEHWNEFQAIKVIDNWIFSHAGITQQWLDFPLGGNFSKEPIDGENQYWTLDDVNRHFRNKNLKYFNHNSYDPYGDDEHEGCMWIRPPALIRMGLEGYNQCVGHTVLDLTDSMYMEYWGLEGRVAKAQDWYDKKKFFLHQYQEPEDYPRNLDCNYVFIDHPENKVCAIINTKTNEVEIIGE